MSHNPDLAELVRQILTAGTPRHVIEQAEKADTRRFTGESITGFGALGDEPTVVRTPAGADIPESEAVYRRGVAVTDRDRWDLMLDDERRERAFLARGFEE